VQPRRRRGDGCGGGTQGRAGIDLLGQRLGLELNLSFGIFAALQHFTS
jgi:hypothetical protein